VKATRTNNDNNKPTENKKNNKKNGNKGNNDKIPNEYRLPPNVWKTLTRKQQEMYKKALKAENKPCADFVECPFVDDNVAHHICNTNTSAFNSADHLNKTEDKTGEEAGNIRKLKPKPRSVMMMKAHKQYKDTYIPQVKTTSKIPEDKILFKEKINKRDFSNINKELAIEHYKIPKMPKFMNPKPLAKYMKNEENSKDMENQEKTHTKLIIYNPPKSFFNPTLADEFCLYFEDYISLFRENMKTIYTITKKQALNMVFNSWQKTKNQPKFTKNPLLMIPQASTKMLSLWIVELILVE
jgi:hypothetical protein